MRYPRAAWTPSPEYAQGRAGQPTKGFVIHSAVGRWQDVHGRFLNPPIDASTHFLVRYDGKVDQFVDTADSAYGNGTPDRWGGADARVPWLRYYYQPIGGIGGPNRVTISTELEGGGPGNFSEPLRPPQYAALVNLTEWVLKAHGLGAPKRHENLLEHNQISATACPSGRIPWDRLIADVQARMEDLDMATAAELQREIDGVKLVNTLQQIALERHLKEIERLTLENLLQQAWLNKHAERAGLHDITEP